MHDVSAGEIMTTYLYTLNLFVIRVIANFQDVVVLRFWLRSLQMDNVG